MTSENEPARYCSECIQRVHICDKMLRQLQAGIVTPDEFHYNVAIHLLKTCDVCKEIYFKALPDSIAFQFDAYLQAMLKAEGVMPLVRPFLVNFRCEQELQLKKQALEPKIDQLRRASRERALGLR